MEKLQFGRDEGTEFYHALSMRVKQMLLHFRLLGGMGRSPASANAAGGMQRGLPFINWGV